MNVKSWKSTPSTNTLMIFSLYYGLTITFPLILFGITKRRLLSKYSSYINAHIVFHQNPKIIYKPTFHHQKTVLDNSYFLHPKEFLLFANHTNSYFARVQFSFGTQKKKLHSKQTLIIREWITTSRFIRIT